MARARRSRSGAASRRRSRVIRAIKPGAVVGFGGYPTLPPVYAATLRSDPDAHPRAERRDGARQQALAARVDAIAAASSSRDGAEASAPRSSSPAIRCGRPCWRQRRAVSGCRRKATLRPAGVRRQPGRAVLLRAVPAAIALLPGGCATRLTRDAAGARRGRRRGVKAAYAQARRRREVSPFFTDMPERIAAAHLVISRSGASTVAELAVDRPAGDPGALSACARPRPGGQCRSARRRRRRPGASAVDAVTPNGWPADSAPLIGDPERLARPRLPRAPSAGPTPRGCSPT